MPVPLPDADHELRTPPDGDEVTEVARGVLTAVGDVDGPTPLQQLLVSSLFTAMTGHEPDVSTATALDAEGLARTLALRGEAYRRRIVQVMALAALVLNPLPEAVSDRLDEYAEALSVRDDLLQAAHHLSEHSLSLVQIDFNRNGYLEEVATSLAGETGVAEVWGLSVDDPALAARWASLGELPGGTIGRGVHDFYRARGFEFPGSPGSAPPLLAQHDWVHVLADYGTTVENELEVFGFIARANDDPRAFSLLAMVVSLFETGALAQGAGLFEADTGHLSRAGIARRLGDAMRRGALCRGSNDFLALDWFALADRPVDVVRHELALPPKDPAAISLGSVGPWQPGGISPYQWAAGQAKAVREGREYDPHGAALIAEQGAP
jgi:hypothetical protein